MSEPTERIRELYRAAPEGFVAARDALAKALKAEGADDGAADVKRRKRPSVAAWALNRLADLDPGGIEELEQAGATLRSVMSGSDADALRAATAARRTIVARLSQAAAGILREAGRSPDAHRDDLASTIEAASVDDAVAERLRTGTLERTVSGAVGFGEIGGLHLVDTSEDEEASGSAPLLESAARREQARIAREAADAERAAQEAERGVEELKERIASAEERLGAERDALRKAETAARGARLEARRAAAALERAGRRSH